MDASINSSNGFSRQLKRKQGKSSGCASVRQAYQGCSSAAMILLFNAARIGSERASASPLMNRVKRDGCRKMPQEAEGRNGEEKWGKKEEGNG